MKKYGLHCRLATIIKTLIRPKVNTATSKSCRRKLQKVRRQKCDIAEVSVTLGGLCPGFHCNGCQCTRRILYTSDDVSGLRESTSAVASVNAHVDEVLEQATLATAVRMRAATPTTVYISRSVKRKQYPQGRRSTSIHTNGTEHDMPLTADVLMKLDPVSLESYLEKLVREAMNGNVQCQAQLLALYREVLAPDTQSRSCWSSSQRRLICKARLVLGLEMQRAVGRIAADVADKVSAQLFSHGSSEEAPMHREEFAAYIRRLVDHGELPEARAGPILLLASAEEHS